MKPTAHITSAGLLFVAGLSACIIDSVPIPDWRDKSPYPDQMAADSPEAGGVPAGAEPLVLYSTNPVILVGLPGAMAGAGELTVLNPARQGWHVTVVTSADGSFALPLNAGVGETIIVSFAGGTPWPLAIQASTQEAADKSADLLEQGGTPAEASSAYAAVTASAPDASGLVTVSAPASTLPFGMSVVVTDLTRPAVGFATTAQDGSFSTSLAAQAGDELYFFLVRSGTANGGRTFKLLVP